MKRDLGNILGLFFLSKFTVSAIISILEALLLGYVAYGLSIFFCIKAQKDIGAAKTSAYYAIAPFAGAFLSFLILHEPLTLQYATALTVMIAGSAIAVVDTMLLHHRHMHTHVITHTHDGSTHTHVITHSHEHDHFLHEGEHQHHHEDLDLSDHDNVIYSYSEGDSHGKSM